MLVSCHLNLKLLNYRRIIQNYESDSISEKEMLDTVINRLDVYIDSYKSSYQTSKGYINCKEDSNALGEHIDNKRTLKRNIKKLIDEIEKS